MECAGRLFCKGNNEKEYGYTSLFLQILAAVWLREIFAYRLEKAKYLLPIFFPQNAFLNEIVVLW